MDVQLNEDQTMLQEMTRRFLEDKSPIGALRRLAEKRASFDRDVWRQSAELGWIALFVPEENGGIAEAALGVADAAIVAEELGRVVFSGPFLSCSVVAFAIALTGSGTQRQEWLPGLSRGETTAAWCFAGPGTKAGIEPGSVVAARGGEGYVLDGVAGYVEHAEAADLLLVTSSSDDGIVQFVLPAASKGISIQPMETVDLGRSIATATARSGSGERLMRGVRYIEQNIESSISLADIAGEAALSEFHFHRLFRSRYGISVMDYVRRRRLAKAAESLVRTEASILEIALDAGFESQAAFTRAFRRVFHTTPANYRARACDVPWLSVATLSEDVLATLPGLGIIDPRLEEIDAFSVAGIDAVLAGHQRPDIPRLWERLFGTIGPGRFQSGPRYGISDVLPDVLGGTFRYIAGVSDGMAVPLARGLASFTVPGGRFAVFTFRGSPDRLASAIDYLFSAWMPCSDLEVRISPCFERYPERFVPSDDCEFEIWIPVKSG